MVTLLDLVQEDVDHLRVGARESRARCPLCASSSASLSINAEKGLWVCYRCGEAGDAIDWLRKVRGMSFPAARRLLDDRSWTWTSARSDSPAQRRERAATRDFEAWRAEHYLRMVAVLGDVDRSIACLERMERFDLTLEERETLHKQLDWEQGLRVRVIRRLDKYDPNPLADQTAARAEWEKEGRSATSRLHSLTKSHHSKDE